MVVVRLDVDVMTPAVMVVVVMMHHHRPRRHDFRLHDDGGLHVRGGF